MSDAPSPGASSPGATSPAGRARGWDAALVSVAVLLVAARIYKAHAAGIVFDEAMSFLHFGSVHAALTSYEYPNNHVLNSLLIALSARVLPAYEHAIRLHGVVSGAILVGATLLLVRELIARRWLALLALLLVGSNAFLFDLSFLARGYAIALAVTTAGLVPLVRWCREGLAFGRRWRLFAWMVVVNVLTAGSMISALPFLVAWNLLVAFLVLPRCLHGAEAGAVRRARWSYLAWVGLGSALLLHLLYWRLYGPILAWPRDFQMRPTLKFARQLLVLPLAPRGDRVAAAGLGLLTVVVVALRLRTLRGLLGRGRGLEPTDRSGLDPLVLVMATLASTVALLLLQRHGFGVSLGFPRNESFLLPWLWIGGIAGLDRGLDDLGPRLRGPTAMVVAGTLALLVVRGRPEPAAVQIARFESQSAAGPLFRALRELDPDRAWSVLPTEETRYFGLLAEHYRRYGHRVHTVPGSSPADVRVWRASEEEAYGPFFRAEELEPFELRVRLAEGLAPAR